MIDAMTKKYEQFYEQEKERLTQLLKVRLREAIYETDKEVADQFNFHVDDLYNELFTKETDGKKITSWFKRKIVEQYRRDKDRYAEGKQIEGFLKNILPNIEQEFRVRYENADERLRSEKYFDQEVANKPDHDQIIRLLALYNVYRFFFDQRLKLKNDLREIINKEKYLVERNNFNNLPPIEILEFILQLLQKNPSNSESFLTEKQAYDLTNMICNNKPVANPIELKISLDQKNYIIRFFYEFYKYCNVVDKRAKREEFIDLIYNYIDPFFSNPDITIYKKSFARPAPDSPIKIDKKYKVWEKRKSAD